MKINVLSISSNKLDWVQKVFKDYCIRFNNSLSINWRTIKPEKVYSKSNNIIKIEKEGKKLLSSIASKGKVIPLDRKGEDWDTPELKKNFDKWIASSQYFTFLIGDPDGLSKDCLNHSHKVISLSPMTFSHVMVSIILIEQLYRVWTISQNHPYHR